jgi:hypothetical protein
MALSGSQITGTGVIGFPGQAYAGFTPKAEFTPAPSLSFGVLSIIDPNGQGVLSSISAQGQGVLGEIVGNFGVLSIIDSTGQGVPGDISETGQGVEGDMK